MFEDFPVPRPIPSPEVSSKASALSKINPTSGRNSPYDPELVVYPVPVYALPFDPDTI